MFYEGPPTANGKPGVHHVEPRTFKDVYPRFKTMTGHLVPRKGGWDCHGLPVELEVEKEIGTTGKRDIEAFGIAGVQPNGAGRRCSGTSASSSGSPSASATGSTSTTPTGR